MRDYLRCKESFIESALWWRDWNKDKGQVKKGTVVMMMRTLVTMMGPMMTEKILMMQMT
jgi:hypothetical protein